MAWELHKKKGKELYAVWSTIVDDYIYEFNTKEVIQKNLEDHYRADAVRKAEDFMYRLDEEVD